MRDVAAVVLAAGASTRLGTPKQLLRFNGESLVRGAVRAVLEAGCAPVVVVVGDLAARLDDELDGLEVVTAQNEQSSLGLGTSIRCGVEGVLSARGDIAAVVLLACDQPFVDAQTITTLIDAWRRSDKRIAASQYADTAGIPALFSRACFDALLALPNDSGAKPLITSHLNDTVLVSFARGEIDIDIPADIARLTGEL